MPSKTYQKRKGDLEIHQPFHLVIPRPGRTPLPERGNNGNGKDTVAWLSVVDNLAHKADTDGNHSAACYYFAVALEPCAGFVGSDNVNTLNIEQKLALNLFNNDRQPDAQRLFNDILAKCTGVQEKGKLDNGYRRVVRSIIGCCCEYARGFSEKKNFRKARVEYERVLKTSEKLLGATAEETSKIKFNLDQTKAREKEANETRKAKQAAEKPSGGKDPVKENSSKKNDNSNGKKHDNSKEKKKDSNSNEKKGSGNNKKKDTPANEKKDNKSPAPGQKPKPKPNAAPSSSALSPSRSPSPGPTKKPSAPPSPKSPPTHDGPTKKPTTAMGQHLQVPPTKPRSRSVGADHPRSSDAGADASSSFTTSAKAGKGEAPRPRAGSDVGTSSKTVIRGKLFDAVDSSPGGRPPVKLDQLSSAEMKKNYKAVQEWSTGRVRQTHAFFEKRRSNVEYAPDKTKDKKDRSKRRVRIAILDTGVDMTHPEIVARKDRIQDTLCTIPDLLKKNEKAAKEDTCGHGTCATLLTMQIAPEADIYVARVFQAAQDVVGDNAEAVDRAISHAVEEWEVDILSLSFGFPKPVGGVERALRRATEKDVLVFAAASNDGANAEISRAWPARDDTRVFCVYATDRDGASWARNPPRESAVANFATLGVDVLSAWTGGKMLGKTGTSVATPIAAATAALFLDFARLPRLKGKNIENVDKVASFRGMRLLLLASSTVVGEHNLRYIKPWHVFKLHEFEYESIRLAIQTELRKL